MGEFCIEEKMNEIDAAKMMADERVKDAVNGILVELVRAEQLHPVLPEDEQDGIMIIEDQLEGVFYAEKGSDRLRHKLHATAAMCIRYLINMDIEK